MAVLESEDNLNQEGDAWLCGEDEVYGNAWVCGDAEVSGNAKVSGNAEVSGNAQVSLAFSAIHLPFSPYPITITDYHVSVGCQQFTFEEFYGTFEEQAELEGISPQEYSDMRDIIIPIMTKIEREREVNNHEKESV